MAPSRLLSTVDVPAQHLKAAFLTGIIPFKILHSHPYISYTLYIPEGYLNPDPDLAQGGETKDLPAVYSLPLLPLIVTVHGTRRGAERCRDALIPLAQKARAAILAPLFPAGNGIFDSLEEYKVLRTKTYQSDLALLSILDEVKVRWPGIATDKIFMTGFSGGGQLVHRFMYIYPNRLHAVSIGGPGSITLLDSEADWPKGIRNISDIFGVSAVDVASLRHVRIQLIGGAEDTDTHGGEEFWRWLAEKKKELKGTTSSTVAKAITEKQIVKNRLSTLRLLKQDLEEHGIESELELVDNAKHESLKMLPKITECFLPLIQQAQGE